MAEEDKTLRDALTDYRTARSADLKLQGNYFYRRNVPDKSANYYAAFPDLYDNNDDVHVITGGGKNRFVQYDVKVADKPVFGSSELSGLFLCPKVSSITNAPTDGVTGQTNIGMKVFVQDVEIHTEGGHSSAGTSLISNDEITAFCTYFDEEPPSMAYTEIFDGVGEDESMDLQQGQLIVQKEAYLEADVAYRLGERTGKKGVWGWRGKKSFRGKWCDNHPELGWICKIKRKYGSRWVSSIEKKTIYNWNTENFIIPSKMKKKYVKYISEVPIPSKDNPYSVDSGNVISTENSTLHDIKSSQSFHELSTSGGVKQIAWGKCSFSSDNAMEGGQSAKLHTFWPALTNDSGFRRTNIFYSSDNTNIHTQQRQECYIVKKLPIPKLYQSHLLDDGALEPQNKDMGHNVQVRVNISKLALCEQKKFYRTAPSYAQASAQKSQAYIVKSGGVTITNPQDPIQRTYTRGIALCFSEFAPGWSDIDTRTSDDTFYSFIKRHAPDMETRDSQGYGAMTNANDFCGVFIVNHDGNYIIEKLGYGGGTTSTKTDFLVDPFTHKIGGGSVSALLEQEGSASLGLQDKWLDFNFIFNTEAGGFNLVITDSDDPKTAIYRTAVANFTNVATNVKNTFPPFLSIWNCNYPNPNQGMSGAAGASRGGLNNPNLKEFSDTGLVYVAHADSAYSLDGSADPATIIPRYEGISDGEGGYIDDPVLQVGDGNSTSGSVIQSLTGFMVADRHTGEQGGTLERYWALIAGTSFLLQRGGTDSANQALTYFRLDDEKQYTSEAKYYRVTKESGGQLYHTTGDPILMQYNHPIDGGIPAGMDAETLLYVDSIKLHNFAPTITNATVSHYNSNHAPLKIPVTHMTYDKDYADIAAWTGTNQVGPFKQNTWSYWSLGFDLATDIMGSEKFFLLNGFNTTNPTNVTMIRHDKSFKSGVKAGYVDGTEALGYNGDNMYNARYGAARSITPTLRGLPVWGTDNTAAESEMAVSVGTNYIDGFTQKGFFDINFTDTADVDAAIYSITKRENSLAAARVIEIVNAKEGKVRVDNKSIFRLDPSTQYIMYKEGQPFATTSYKILTVKKRIDDEIHFDKDLTTPDGSGTDNFMTANQLGNMFVSPYKFWLNIAFLNGSGGDSGTDTYLPERSWDSIVGLSEIGAIGTTHNEYYFHDGKYNQYSRIMDPFNEVENNDVRNDVDYGFGKFDEELDTGGYAGKVTIDNKTVSTAAAVQNLKIDCSGIVKALSPETGKNLSLLLTPLSAFDENQVTVFAEEHSTESYKPFLLTEFFDELPVITDFIVKPDEDNAFYPHYTWDCSDNDIWYGFLLIDSTQIGHQYHNAEVYLPLNQEGAHGQAPTVFGTYEKINSRSTTGSGVLFDIEGLSGYCLNFDGNDDYIEVNTGAGSDPTANCTKEMSIIAHIIPDSASDSRYIIAQSNRDDREKFHIRLNSSNQVEARAHFDGGANYVDLTSTSIIPTDGETPTCVMLVVDTEITSGNVKLYLNGKLEDLSGQTTTAGGTNNWKLGASINGGNSEIYIGNSASSGTNGFDGKIEEVVIYKKAIYPFSGKVNELTITKPFPEIDETSSTASLSQMAKIFVKDYHNIRGKTTEQVATAPAVSFRKAAFRLDNS